MPMDAKFVMATEDINPKQPVTKALFRVSTVPEDQDFASMPFGYTSEPKDSYLRASAKRRVGGMGKILVTGASGDIGRKTLLHLLKLKPADQLIGLARDPSKAADLAAKGIEVRQGDYFDRDSLSRAFQGVEKLMLTSTHAFTDRKTAHANVIDVAAETGVRHLVYMPIYHKAGSTFTMKEITEEDIFSIEKMRSSGLAYTLVQHPPFMEPAMVYAGPNAVETGVRVPAGNGKAR